MSAKISIFLCLTFLSVLAETEKIKCYSGTPLDIGGISTTLSETECDEGVTQCKTWHTIATESIKQYGCSGQVEKQQVGCTKDALGLTTTCYCDGALCNEHSSAHFNSANIITFVSMLCVKFII